MTAAPKRLAEAIPHPHLPGIEVVGSLAEPESNAESAAPVARSLPAAESHRNRIVSKTCFASFSRPVRFAAWEFLDQPQDAEIGGRQGAFFGE